jgi:hypothetical protein
MVVNLEVEFRKNVGPTSMTRGKLTMLGIKEVLMIGKDLYGVRGSKEDITPHTKCVDNCKEFAIIYGIISLWC